MILLCNIQNKKISMLIVKARGRKISEVSVNIKNGKKRKLWKLWLEVENFNEKQLIVSFQIICIDNKKKSVTYRSKLWIPVGVVIIFIKYQYYIIAIIHIKGHVQA